MRVVIGSSLLVHTAPPCLRTTVRWQGLAESYADEAAGRAVQRQEVLANLHKTVQHRQDSTAQQIATHQSLVDRQARRNTCCWLYSSVLHDIQVSLHMCKGYKFMCKRSKLNTLQPMLVSLSCRWIMH